MYKTHGLICVLLLSVLFAAVMPAHAGTMDVTGLPSATGNCTTAVLLYHDFSIAGTTADVTAPDRDAIALVLYDGEGTAFAYIGISVTVGFSGTSTTFGWNYPILIQPATRPFTLRIYDNIIPVSTASANIVGAQQGALLDVFQFDPAPIGICGNLPLHTTPIIDTTRPSFTDGRINNYDIGAPIAVYGQDFDEGRGLVIYGVDADSHGYIVLIVEPSQIADIPDCPDTNILIASDNGVSVYRLTSCAYQVNMRTHTGKLYSLVFTVLYPNNAYTSSED